LAGQAHGQIYVANSGIGTIGEYNLDGTTINSSLVSGLNGPTGENCHVEVDIPTHREKLQ